MIPKTFAGLLFLAGLFLFTISYFPGHIKIDNFKLPGLSKQGQKVFRKLGVFFLILSMIPPFIYFLEHPFVPFPAFFTGFATIFGGKQ